jgi:NAD-dependent DNA ligase
MTTPLIDTYITAKTAYYAGTPLMTDSAFDALERQIALTNPELLLQIGAPPRSGKVDLPVPMGSLNQVYDQAEFKRWASKFPPTALAVLTEKIDGNSALLQYRNGVLMNSFSRGNGVQGANNLRHTRLMTSIPQTIGNGFTGTIRGELVISKADWPKVKELATSHSGKDYANARNFTAGFLNGKTGNIELYKYFQFIAFEINDPTLSKQRMMSLLIAAGFTTPVTDVHAINQLSFDKCRTICDSMVADSKYEADGIVLDIDDPKLRDSEIDLDDLNPSHAIKIKPESGTATTTITSVSWSASKDGYIKPVVHFEPVQLAGVTIRKASGYNAKYVFDNGIGVGAVAAISRRGDVIPRVEEVLVPVEAEMPPNCEWNSTGVDLITTDNSHQTAVDLQILEHFFAKLDVDHIGAGNVQKLFDSGIDTPTKAIAVADTKAFEYAFGSNGAKASASLRKQLSTVTPARLFAALGSFGRGMGERKLNALFAVIPFETVLNGPITTVEIATIDGFENRSARKILDHIDDAREQYESIKSFVTFVEKAAPVSGKLTGQVYCPTGVRFDSATVEKITSQGGEVTDTFSGKVNVLVTKDVNSGSSKIEKARQKGVTIISLDQLKAQL